MSDGVSLRRDVRLAAEIAEQIRAAGIDEDDPDFVALMSAECDGLNERLVRMMRAARHAELAGDALATMASDMQARRRRLQDKSDRLKQIVRWAMEESGLKRIEAPDLSASIRVGGQPPLQISVPVEELPQQFQRVSREPDKARLRAALKEGASIPGVCFGNTPTILSPHYR